MYRQVHIDWSHPYSIFIKGARDEAPLTTIFKFVQYLLYSTRTWGKCLKKREKCLEKYLRKRGKCLKRYLKEGRGKKAQIDLLTTNRPTLPRRSTEHPKGWPGTLTLPAIAQLLPQLPPQTTVRILHKNCIFLH